MATENYLGYINRCEEEYNCGGALFSDSDGKVLVKKLAEKLDGDSETLILWYDDIAQIPDTEVKGATYYRVIDGVITDQTITLAEFLDKTNWGARSYMIVGTDSDDSTHYWASLTCGSIAWYNTKQKYAFESTAGFTEILTAEFPIQITDGRTKK